MKDLLGYLASLNIYFKHNNKMLQKTLEIYRVSEKLPDSIWSKHTPNYSKHCIVWDDMLNPLLAYYDRKNGTWYCDEELISFNSVFNVIYWAEIPEDISREVEDDYNFELERYFFTNEYDLNIKQGNPDWYDVYHSKLAYKNGWEPIAAVCFDENGLSVYYYESDNKPASVDWKLILEIDYNIQENIKTHLLAAEEIIYNYLNN